MLSVQHNMLAINADRNLNTNTKKNAKLAEQLSSGYRINRAADDAAGLAISEKMRRQIRGLRQSAENIKDGIGYVQTAEGALSEVHDMLQRMNELAVQAANGTNTESDRAYINSEVQALKEEIDRIFSTTTFNERRIWDPDEVTPIVGAKPEQVVSYTNSTQYIDITNANCGVIAKGGYLIDANEDGVLVSWTGYDGNSYETERFSWDEIEKNNYSFEVKPTDDKGVELFSFKVSMNVHDGAPLEDIIESINGYVMSSTPHVYMTAEFEDTAGNKIDKEWIDKDGNKQSPVSVSATLNYAAAYASYVNTLNDNPSEGFDFDSEKDTFIDAEIKNGTNLTCPNITTADDAKLCDETWIFSFKMEGIGSTKIVTAESVSGYFWSTDVSSTFEGVWWEWEYPLYGERYKGHYLIPLGGGSPSVIMSALTEHNGGLLSTSGGYITLNFNLSAADAYDNDGNKNVGTLSITIPIYGDDTENSVIERIQNVFNDTTILDLYTSASDVTNNANTSSDYSSIGVAYIDKHYIDVPVYGRTVLEGKEFFWVQSGAEAGQHIEIEYDSLSLWALGIQDTNTLTVEDASNAINEIKDALIIVSDQRSLFGAYQNRLEHAYNINKNVEENTQASESLIRDTDIADAMMEYSINNILLQAGVSMLTQANQSSQLMLELLQ